MNFIAALLILCWNMHWKSKKTKNILKISWVLSFFHNNKNNEDFKVENQV